LYFNTQRVPKNIKCVDVVHLELRNGRSTMTWTWTSLKPHTLHSDKGGFGEDSKA